MKWRMSLKTFLALQLIALRPDFSRIILTLPNEETGRGGTFYFLACPVEFDTTIPEGSMQLLPDEAKPKPIPVPTQPVPTSGGNA